MFHHTIGSVSITLKYNGFTMGVYVPKISTLMYTDNLGISREINCGLITAYKVIYNVVQAEIKTGNL